MRARIEIFDLETQSAQSVLDTTMHVEAPNWMPDGSALVVNAGGQLFRVPLEAPALHWIDTGPCTSLNNDHGPSPDGRLMAMSDRHETPGSCIYVMPMEGGSPRRVTPDTPSWFHGWSADSQELLYTLVRKDAFGIGAIPAKGGAERIIIGGPGHYDGPDMTPDGNWIWFNSDRGGAMHLWRVRPDGSDPQQMSFGQTVDWFPHPSPDQKHIVYLAYPQDTEGHPFGRHVSLNLMPAEGGEPRILVRLFGGQGTINVNSWAPDSRRFAYVRYFEDSEGGS